MKRIDINLAINVPDWSYHLATFVLLKYRRLRYGYPFRLIKLTKGRHAMVDPENFEWLSLYKWHASDGRAGNFYAVNSRMQRMHRMIMKGQLNSKSEYRNTKQIRSTNDKNSKLVVDHINGNGLDNRRANLRLATVSQNNWNSKSGFNRGKSKYKGVRWHKRRQKWAAGISMYRRKQHLGYFTDQKQAAKAFDKAAKELHGEFAVFNFPPES